MKTITAKYPGRCIRTGASIQPGDAIIWHGRGRAELAASDPEAAGRYLARSLARSVSDVWYIGGREYYRNKRGLCEDAPCCGCCNA